MPTYLYSNFRNICSCNTSSKIACSIADIIDTAKDWLKWKSESVTDGQEETNEAQTV